MKGHKLVLTIFVLFSIFDLAPVYGASLDQMKPGVVGYATKQLEQMSEADKAKYATLLKCTFMAIRLKYDDDASNFLAQAIISSTVPPWWGDWYTETSTYFKGYVDGLFVNNSKLMGPVYDKTCRPILTKNK